MDLRNCPKCGKLFAYNGNNKLCPVCRDNEEEKFQTVKDYLWEHPHATIEQVHEATEVENELILKFVKDGRIISEGLDSSFFLECERCGDAITSGRFCKSCQQELVNGFTKGSKKRSRKKKNPKKDSGRMHISDRVRRRKDK